MAAILGEKQAKKKRKFARFFRLQPANIEKETPPGSVLLGRGLQLGVGLYSPCRRFQYPAVTDKKAKRDAVEIFYCLIEKIGPG
jgi:hypothetical protein